MNVPQVKPEDAGWFQRMMPTWVVMKWRRKFTHCDPILMELVTNM
jgi:hypothetical protein